MTATSLEGRDPVTGQVLRVDLAGSVVAGLTRLGHSADPDLPYLAPGLIDLQVNGYAGHDVNAADVSVEVISALTAALAAEGVTTWVPTVITASEDRVRAALEVIAAAKRQDPAVDAAVPYAHVEGPFISDQDGPRGVHAKEWVRPIDAAEVARWATSGVLGYVTVSPHWDDSPAQIAAIRSLGVRVAIGHTHATPEQIRAAVDAGATLSTHLGNGVAVQLPRHPNQLWTQLAEDRLTCGFIADGHHLPDDTLTVMLRAKGPDRAFLVSDSVALAGSPPGRYYQPVGGGVELSADGRLSYAGTQMLAGSAVSNADCLRHVIARCGYALADALPLVTTVPGRVLAAAGRRLGVLQVGVQADLVLVDARGEVLEVVQQGRPVAARSRS